MGDRRGPNAVRLGLRRQAHHQPDAEPFHELSAATNDFENEAEVARKAQSGRTAAWSAHALRLALRREAHRHDDAEALRSMRATAKGVGRRRVLVAFARAWVSVMSPPLKKGE